MDKGGGQWVGCFEFCDLIWVEWESKASTIKDQRRVFAHSGCWGSRHFVLVCVSGGGRVVESDSGRMPNVVVYLYLLNTHSRRGERGGLQKKGMMERRSFWICLWGEAASDWTLAAGIVVFCCLLERGGLRKEKCTQVSGRRLAASALPTHLTPVTGGFCAALGREAPGQSATSRPAPPLGSSLLPGHLGPAAALHS